MDPILRSCVANEQTDGRCLRLFHIIFQSTAISHYPQHISKASCHATKTVHRLKTVIFLTQISQNRSTRYNASDTWRCSFSIKKVSRICKRLKILIENSAKFITILAQTKLRWSNVNMFKSKGKKTITIKATKFLNKKQHMYLFSSYAYGIVYNCFLITPQCFVEF